MKKKEVELGRFMSLCSLCKMCCRTGKEGERGAPAHCPSRTLGGHLSGCTTPLLGLGTSKEIGFHDKTSSDTALLLISLFSLLTSTFPSSTSFFHSLHVSQSFKFDTFLSFDDLIFMLTVTSSQVFPKSSYLIITSLLNFCVVSLSPPTYFLLYLSWIQLNLPMFIVTFQTILPDFL